MTEMLTKYTDKWISQKKDIIKMWTKRRPENYDAIFKELLRRIYDEDDYQGPDPERLTVIDHGDYQGTRVFVVGATGYQPSTYYICMVSYGSCSGCDTFQATVSSWGSDSEEDPKSALAAWTLGLHMAQHLRKLGVIYD